MADVLTLFRFDRDGLYHNTQHTISPRLLVTGGTKQSIHSEPSGLAMVDVWWPVLGRMHVRRKTGQPEWDLGSHSQAIKGPHEYYCALLSNSPQLFTKGWPTHTKNIAAKWWRRLQQLPLCSAQSSSTFIAQRRTSPVLCKLCDSSKRLLFLPHSGCPRLASSEPERRAVAILMARFASPPLSPKISFYTVILSA